MWSWVSVDVFPLNQVDHVVLGICGRLPLNHVDDVVMGICGRLSAKSCR